MKDKVSKPKAGDKMEYIGKGFLGFDPNDRTMTYMGRHENSQHDIWVEYKGAPLVVMEHEVKPPNPLKK